MEDLIAAAAAAMKMPEDLVRKSADARARAQGVSTEEVLRSWAGGEEIAAAATSPEAPPAPAPDAEQEPAGPPEEPAGPPEESAAPPEAEELALPEPEQGPAGGEEPAAETTAVGVIPRWLAAVFLLLPAFAVAYALFFPNGPSCGDAGALAVDPVTGAAVGCDGGPYGVETADFFSIGRDVYPQCSSCHGENGGGGGNFPAFTGGALLAAFPDGTCEEQVEWVRLGTSGWPEPTYGANDTPVGGSGAVMPGFGAALTEQELRAVVLYERVRFGGVDLEVAIDDCGLGEDAGGGE